MILVLSYKTKQFFFVLIKLSIVVIAFYFIHHKLTNNVDLSFSKFVSLLVTNQLFSIKNTILLLVLTFFNWFFEILKWKKLVSNIREIRLKSAIEQSLGSLTASLFTPNRIGEYGAKAMYFSSGLRKHIMGLNLISNLLQMLVTSILGGIGLTYFILEYKIEVNLFKTGFIITCVFTIAILALFGIKTNMLGFKNFSYNKIQNAIKNLSKQTLKQALTYAFLRYAVFSFQFYIILQLLHLNISYIDAMASITSMYLISSIVPTIFIFDVVIKGSIAVYLFSFWGISAALTLTAVTLMWIYNFVLPSIIGSYYVLNYKLPSQTSNHDNN